MSSEKWQPFWAHLNSACWFVDICLCKQICPSLFWIIFRLKFTFNKHEKTDTVFQLCWFRCLMIVCYLFKFNFCLLKENMYVSLSVKTLFFVRHHLTTMTQTHWLTFAVCIQITEKEMLFWSNFHYGCPGSGLLTTFQQPMMTIAVLEIYWNDTCKIFLWTGTKWLLCMASANERQRYIVTLVLIGWAYTQNTKDIYGLLVFNGHLANCGLTHCDLVTTYGAMELGQHWLR